MWKWKFGWKILNLNLSFFVRSYSGAEALREICIFFFMKYLGIIMVNFLQTRLIFPTETKRKFFCLFSIKWKSWLFVTVTHCDGEAISGPGTSRLSTIDIFWWIPRYNVSHRMRQWRRAITLPRYKQQQRCILAKEIHKGEIKANIQVVNQWCILMNTSL